MVQRKRRVIADDSQVNDRGGWIHDRITRSTAGTENGQAKLNDQWVAAILQTVHTVDCQWWADSLGVSRLTIKRIRERKSWRHVSV